MKISKRDALMWMEFFASLPEEEALLPRQQEIALAVLSQIEAENARISAEKAAAKQQPARGAKKHGKAQGQKGRAPHHFEPDVPELANAQGEDRYAQMAVQAEKLQRDKVLAEATEVVDKALAE